MEMIGDTAYTDWHTMPGYNEKQLKSLYPNCVIKWNTKDNCFSLLEFIKVNGRWRPRHRKDILPGISFSTFLDQIRFVWHHMNNTNIRDMRARLRNSTYYAEQEKKGRSRKAVEEVAYRFKYQKVY